jgi:very-short-patch-repair endonuclease
MILCEYGCKNEGKYLLKNSKYCCNEHWQACPTMKVKTGSPKIGKTGPNKDKKFSNEWKENIRKSLKGKNTGPKSEETKQKLRKPKLNSEKMGKYKRTDKHKKEASIRFSGENNFRGMLNKKHKDESILSMREKRLKYYSENDGYWLNKKMSEDSKNKMSKSRKELFKDEDFLKNFKDKNIKISIPNKQEIIIIEILNFLFPEQYKFVGDFSLWINGKNPDFINNKEKKIIEFFGEHWHNKEDEKFRKDFFKKEGYDVLVIWDYELKNIENVKNKIIEFNGE